MTKYDSTFREYILLNRDSVANMPSPPEREHRGQFFIDRSVGPPDQAAFVRLASNGTDYEKAILYTATDLLPPASIDPAGANAGDLLQLVAGVWAAAFPASVIFNWFSAVASTTPTTTSTATFQTAGSGAWVLPTGTWTVFAIGFHRAKRSAAGLINTRVTVDGTAGTVMDSTQDASVFGSAFALCGKTGVASGSRTIALEYKNNSAATATSENPMIFTIAMRTA